MMAELSLAVSLLLLFVIFPLITMNKSRSANKWLAIYIVCLASISFSEYADSIRFYQDYPRLWGWFDLAFSLIGFSYYQYCNSLVGRQFRAHQLWHFFPVLLLFGFILQVHLRLDDAAMREALIADEQSSVENNYLTLFFQSISAAYMFAAIYRLYQFRSQLKQHYSSLHARDFQWLVLITGANLLMLLLWFFANESDAGLSLQLVFRLLLVYALVWYGIKQAPIFSNNNFMSDGINDVITEKERKYLRSGLTESAADIIEVRLKNLMLNQKRFLEPDLTLNQLAESLGASPQWLSQYINQYHQCNFFDYINNFRINEVQLLMCNPHHANQNLLELAMSAGFNSKSTFNSTFKKSTGFTPSQWRKQQLNMSSPIGLDELNA